jgi:hypothetical protein
MFNSFSMVNNEHIHHVQFNCVQPVGIEIARNGIYITRDMADKALGDGFVAFVNMDNAYKAIYMHDQKHIQHRFGRTWSLEGKRGGRKSK